MVRIEQIKRGLSAFADTELVPKMTGIQKWIFAAGVSAYLANADALVDKWMQKPIVKDLEIIREDKTIDVDKMYRFLKEAARKGPAEMDIPMVGKITLTEADLDKIYTLILQ